jgi:hypothetical protein
MKPAALAFSLCSALCSACDAPPDVVTADNLCEHYAEQGCLQEQGYESLSSCKEDLGAVIDSYEGTSCKDDSTRALQCAWVVDSECHISCDDEFDAVDDCVAAHT